MASLKKVHRVSIEFPDDGYTLANEKLIAYFVSDDHAELRVGIGYRAVAWYFETLERADSFADLASKELQRFNQFKVTQP